MRFDTKGIATKEDVNDASTNNVDIDAGKKNQKGKKHKKGNSEVLPSPTSSDALTSHSTLYYQRK